MRVRVDQADFTLGELADVEELLGSTLTVAFETSQPRAIAALATVAARRDDPTFTLDQALKLKMSEIELVAADPTELASDNGMSRPPSLAPGR